MLASAPQLVKISESYVDPASVAAITPTTSTSCVIILRAGGELSVSVSAAQAADAIDKALRPRPSRCGS